MRSTESFDRGDIDSQIDFLERHFADAGWEAPRLLRAARAAPDFYLDSMGQVRLDRWSQGRVVLLGDAGYCPSPLSGLGTSLALVGAYILAGELAAFGEATTEEIALSHAFNRYESGCARTSSKAKNYLQAAWTGTHQGAGCAL